MSRLPILTPREMVAALKKAGFVEDRQRGSHLILIHSDGRRSVVPMHAAELPRGTMLAIIKQAGFTQDQFLKYL